MAEASQALAPPTTPGHRRQDNASEGGDSLPDTQSKRRMHLRVGGIAAGVAAEAVACMKGRGTTGGGP